MNDPNNTYSDGQGYDTNGYGMSGYESESYGYSSEGYRNDSYSNHQSEPYGAPDYFADGYRENVYEGDLNLADTPWTETAANPNPYFHTGVKYSNTYQDPRTTSYSDYDELEL